MSGALKLGNLKWRFAIPRSGPVLNGAGSAGPRRLAVMGLIACSVIIVVTVVMMSGRQAPVVSRDARMSPVDPLPGGLHSTPEQDALARRSSDDLAQAALGRGVSFTPPLGPSVPAVPPPPRAEPAAASDLARSKPRFVGRQPPQPSLTPAAVVPPPPIPRLAAPPVTAAPAMTVAAMVDPKEEATYAKSIDSLFGAWGGRPPQTTVVLPPADPSSDPPGDPPAGGARTPRTTAVRAASSAAPATAREADPGEILIPAGRGVYAHPILTVNSDASSPVVLQADSGPIAGDRMIGTFSRQAERLVIRINTVVHHGVDIGTDGLVIAPDTMEAGVASDVDQHYLTRFVLPAAAAFIQGLGQAIATTSNSTAVLSPFGGATTVTNLNLQQQLGVAAGTAAGQIGSVLNQAAPKGPTVTLEANVAVGVMFLSPVTLHHGG